MKSSKLLFFSRTKFQVAEMLLTLYSRFLDSDEMFLGVFWCTWRSAHCIDCGTFCLLITIINCKHTYSSVAHAQNGWYVLRAKEMNNIMMLHGGEENKLIAKQNESSPIAMWFFCMLDWWQLFTVQNEGSRAAGQLQPKVKQSGCTLSATGEERVSLNSTD